MKVTEVAPAFLSARGARRVYGVASTETLALIEALRGVGIEYVLTHQETTAGHVAGVEVYLTGTPGVSLVNSGAGDHEHPYRCRQRGAGSASAHGDHRDYEL